MKKAKIKLDNMERRFLVKLLYEKRKVEVAFMRPIREKLPVYLSVQSQVCEFQYDAFNVISSQKSRYQMT